MLEGLKSAIDAREHKAKNVYCVNILINALSHYETAVKEIKLGFLAIEQFDKEVSK